MKVLFYQMIVMSCCVLHAASKNLNKKSKTDLKENVINRKINVFDFISHETDFFFNVHF